MIRYYRAIMGINIYLYEFGAYRGIVFTCIFGFSCTYERFWMPPAEDRSGHSSTAMERSYRVICTNEIGVGGERFLITNLHGCERLIVGKKI